MTGTAPRPLRPLPGQAARTPPGEEPVTRAQALDDQRRRILRATGELVGKRGYHGTTLELIVRRARVGYTTFYRVFPDKEAAFLSFFDASATRAGRRMSEAVAGEDGPWPAQVAAALGALFNEISAEPILARACLVEVLTAGPTAVAHYEKALKNLHPILRSGRRFNPRAAELPETLEDTLAGGMLWIPYQRLVAGEAERIPQLLPETLEFVLTPYLGEAEAVRVVEEMGAGGGSISSPLPSASFSSGGSCR